MKQEQAIVWRRLDIPGHEYARIFSEASKYYLDGTTILVYERQFCKLDYLIECNSDWETLAAKISGFVGGKAIEIEIVVDEEKRWVMNGKEIPDVRGCVDIDLNFSPVTNLLPVRRCNLKIGEREEVRAAWLRFPGFMLEPFPQTYERNAETTYSYESSGGAFKATIETDELGMAIKYSNIWEIESGL